MEKLAFRFPWALLLALLVTAYVLLERFAFHDGLEAKDAVDAITGVGVLVIGHGIHQHAHRLRKRDEHLG